MNYRRSASSPVWMECRNCLCEMREFQVVSVDTIGKKTTFRCVECHHHVTLTQAQIEALTAEKSGSIIHT